MALTLRDFHSPNISLPFFDILLGNLMRSPLPSRIYSLRDFAPHVPFSFNGRSDNITWQWGFPSCFSWMHISAIMPLSVKCFLTYSRASAMFCSLLNSTGRANSISLASWALYVHQLQPIYCPLLRLSCSCFPLSWILKFRLCRLQ